MLPSPGWLGAKGQLTDSGIAQMIRKRGMKAGLPNLHAHDFRHAATHHELAAGMTEADVMNKRSWDSPAMLRRYASTTANERAIAATRSWRSETSCDAVGCGERIGQIKFRTMAVEPLRCHILGPDGIFGSSGRWRRPDHRRVEKPHDATAYLTGAVDWFGKSKAVMADATIECPRCLALQILPDGVTDPFPLRHPGVEAWDLPRP